MGEMILLLSEDESHLVTISNKELHTKSGVINLNELGSKKLGEKIKTHLGKEFFIVKPTVLDVLESVVKRSTQVILPKDVAMILAYTGIRNDSLVVDAGTGTGYLAIFIANYLANGKVVTYENDKRFVKIARENIKNSGLKNIKLKERDVTKGMIEKKVDLFTIDLQHPEKVISKAYRSLKIGGWLVVYSPTVEELLSVVNEIKSKYFSEVNIVENIVREWELKRTIRPKTMGIMHTGFLIFARKIK